MKGDSSFAGQPATSDTTDEAGIHAAPLPPGWDEAVRLDEDPATIPDPASVEVPPGLRAEIEGHMANYPDRHSAVLPALAAAQKVHGWCSPQAVDQVAVVMQVTPAYLSSVATFYDMLRTTPAGSRYVYVCTSVACHLVNAKSVYEAIAAEASEQGLEDVELR
ncbi:MAG TPA: NAD(P)H-dependent oxidoreductase subunit E, partial [Thermoleophilaceae bacterium]|nr:NAD(P)H-dependent oxidoreductase subunit E [Thermoleophilaceae bacterium]